MPVGKLEKCSAKPAFYLVDRRTKYYGFGTNMQLFTHRMENNWLAALQIKDCRVINCKLNLKLQCWTVSKIKHGLKFQRRRFKKASYNDILHT